MIIGNANPNFTLGLAQQRRLGQLRRELAVARRVRQGRVQQHGARLRDEGQREVRSRNFLASALTDPIGIDEPAIYSSRWIENGHVHPPAERHGRLHVRPAGPRRRSHDARLPVGRQPAPVHAVHRLRSGSVHRRQHQRRRVARHRLPDVSASPHVHGRRSRRLLSVPDRTALSPTITSYEAYEETLFLVDRPDDPGRAAALWSGTDHLQRLHQSDGGAAGRADTDQRVPHGRRGARRCGVGVRQPAHARWTTGTTCPRSRRTRSSSRRAVRTGTTTATGSRSSSTTGTPTAVRPSPT